MYAGGLRVTLVLAWYFVVTSTFVMFPLTTVGPITTEELCNGQRVKYLAMQLEERLTNHIGECFSVKVDPSVFDRDK